MLSCARRCPPYFVISDQSRLKRVRYLRRRSASLLLDFREREALTDSGLLRKSSVIAADLDHVFELQPVEQIELVQLAGCQKTAKFVIYRGRFIARP